MLKGTKPRVGFRDATLAGDLVQVDPAAGAEATAIGPAQRLKWKVQEHVFTQEPRQIEPIVFKEFHIRLLGSQLAIIAARAVRSSHVQDLELIRHRDRNRF